MRAVDYTASIKVGINLTFFLGPRGSSVPKFLIQTSVDDKRTFNHCVLFSEHLTGEIPDRFKKERRRKLLAKQNRLLMAY